MVMPHTMSVAGDADDTRAVIGWDIGGVNTKVARVRRGTVLAARSRPFELQRAPGGLSPLLVELAAEVSVGPADHHVLTMTAELSQMFRLKRDGVAFVLDAVRSAFGPDRVSVYSVDGCFLSPEEARRMPLVVAAANWSATARLVARTNRDVILLDTGTTTTDIIPIRDGKEVALGRTDPARLASGELVYTGALRSPAEAITTHVPFRGAPAGVSAEGFALAGDVHLWRGDLAPSDYTVPTPDGRPATREFAGERLARVVCADREMLDDAAVSMIADALAEAQVARVADAVWRVALRHATLRTAVVTGLGAFIGGAAARRVGLKVVPLADALGQDAARSATASAVALLYEWSRRRASAT
jgi:probable H4MPT-linked C1 transfer pathway protein